jgi:hypothetical protein
MTKTPNQIKPAALPGKETRQGYSAGSTSTRALADEASPASQLDESTTTAAHESVWLKRRERVKHKPLEDEIL